MPRLPLELSCLKRCVKIDDGLGTHMDTSSKEFENKMRLIFKKFNPLMIWFWRLGFRRWVNAWPSVGGRIMVITHKGRKSGLRRQTPVNYAEVNGEIYCTAGFGSVSDWYRNMLAHPQVEIWLPDGWWAAEAKDISQDAQRLPLLREVIIASGIVGPLMGVDPRKMDDAEFAQLTKEYKLVQIQPTRRLYGTGGPGDLAWIWIPAGLVLLVSLLWIKPKRC